MLLWPGTRPETARNLSKLFEMHGIGQTRSKVDYTMGQFVLDQNNALLVKWTQEDAVNDTQHQDRKII